MFSENTRNHHKYKPYYDILQIHTPVDCAFLPKGILAVTESDNQRIQLFDNKGHSLGTIAEGRIRPKGK